MRKYLNLKNLIFISILVILGILTIIVWTYRPAATPPVIINIVPIDKSTDIPIYIAPTIRFKTEVPLADLNYELSPLIPITPIQTEPTLHTLSLLRPFQPKTQYTLKILWNGQTISSTSFTTQETQTDPALLEEIKSELDSDYPLGQKLPLNKSSYRVVYSAPLTLKITLKSDLLSQQDVIEIVRNWVKENGLDPDGHTYTFSN